MKFIFSQTPLLHHTPRICITASWLVEKIQRYTCTVGTCTFSITGFEPEPTRRPFILTFFWGYTLAGRWGGWGVNILEDARHRIGLLQYNLSTRERVFDLRSYHLRLTLVHGPLWIHNRVREKSSGQTTQFNIWTIWAMNRTSAHPQVEPEFVAQRFFEIPASARWPSSQKQSLYFWWGYLGNWTPGKE